MAVMAIFLWAYEPLIRQCPLKEFRNAIRQLVINS